MTSPAVYDAHVLADGPLLYWPMDEAAGTTVVDLSGSGLDGTYIGAPTLGAAGPLACEDPSDLAPVFTAIAGAGNGQMAYRATSPLGGTGAFTFEQWIRPERPPIAAPFVNTLQQRAFPLADTTMFRFEAYSNGLRARMGQFVAQQVVSWDDYDVRLSCWTHVAITRSGTTVTLYVNGVAVDVGTSAQNITTANLVLGADWVDVFPHFLSELEKEQYHGQIAKFAIFDYALTGARIAERADLGCTDCGWIIGEVQMGFPPNRGWQ